MKKLPLALVVVLIIIGLAFIFSIYFEDKSTLAQVNSFEECLEQGFSVMESHPRQCMTPDGKTFIEVLESNVDEDVIRVFSPSPNSLISSPLQISGEAKGMWFFEGDFPVKLFDELGNEIELNPPYIMAGGDWMTSDFVPFSAEIEFATPESSTGLLVLYKDNPSDKEELDDEIRIPVRFDHLEDDFELDA
jgi:hypothetical protein